MSLNIVILAAGKGTRMQSRLPKVLHKLAGKPLLTHIINTAQQLNPAKILVVVGHASEQVRTALADLPVHWIEQQQQLGTGHALLQAMPHIDDKAQVLVLVGDTPVITLATLQQLITTTTTNALGLLTVNMPNPAGLGRILRDNNGKVIRIVEEKDANDTQRKITEINTGILTGAAHLFKRWLPALRNQNAQGEYYLTDIIAEAVKENIAVNALLANSSDELLTVNDRFQLAQVERYYQQQKAKELMLAGVTILDPARLDIRGDVKIGLDVTLDVNVILEENVIIGSNTYIGANTLLRNVKIGDNVTIKANSIIEDAIIGDLCTIGPFARIRPGTKLKANVHIGNFVEVKNSEIDADSKINHLSYVGDATVGSKVNIGAGTITCNYDGANKHQTIIGNNVFVGSNSSLIAPIKIGDNATIGAGSTIKRQAPADALTLSRSEQRSIEGWERPKKMIKKDQ